MTDERQIEALQRITLAAERLADALEVLGARARRASKPTDFTNLADHVYPEDPWASDFPEADEPEADERDCR